MKSYPFYECLAHEDDPRPGHLLRVAESAENAVLEAGEDLRRIAFLAGLFHDLGKATPYFQIDRLQKKKKNRLTTHSECSACIGWKITEHLALPLWMRISVLIAILRHHGNLEFNSWENAYGTIRQRIKSDENLSLQFESLDSNTIVLWLMPHIRRYSPNKGLNPKDFTLSAVRASFAGIRMSQIRSCFTETSGVLRFLAGYGSLLSADKVDSALGCTIRRPEIPAGLVENYKAQKFGQPDSRMNRLRETISGEVGDQWASNSEHRLFTLTAPTGSGKTLAIFNAALNARHNLSKTRKTPPRIIYCLPFTSVIDQNHKVMAGVMRGSSLGSREDILLKHHHLVPGLYRTKEAEFDSEDAGALLTETWQSEVVITTFYQFLHSLISASNSELKRAGQLCGSIVLMDEVQAIPLRYWKTVRSIFGKAADALNMTFVLLTATRPLIFRQDDPTIKELLPNHPGYFRELSRVLLFCHPQKIGLSTFCRRVIENLKKEFRSTLIILNRRASVKTVFVQLKQALPGCRIIMLSTDLTPWDRKARIRLVQGYLKRNIPCLVVSTQLVEAGVDFSFPVVHREIAPLDAIIQSCGRSNRHDAESLGTVHVWKLYKQDESGKLKEPLWSKVYDVPLIDATADVLGVAEKIPEAAVKFEEKDFLRLSQDYFERCWGRIDQVDLEPYWLKGDFPTLEKQFELIEEGLPRLTCFVSRNAIDAGIWTEYQAIYSSDLDRLEKKKRFKKIRHRFYERVIQVYGSKDPQRDPVILLDSEECYSPETGFLNLPDKECTCIF
jgi:CRISPR-associated endonuclease/helicase Cas3